MVESIAKRIVVVEKLETYRDRIRGGGELSRVVICTRIAKTCMIKAHVSAFIARQLKQALREEDKNWKMNVKKLFFFFSAFCVAWMNNSDNLVKCLIQLSCGPQTLIACVFFCKKLIYDANLKLLITVVFLKLYAQDR